MADSSTGGYLAPQSALTDDLALDVVISRALGSVGGLDPGLARPRYQAKPPTQPPREVTWLSAGATESEGDVNSSQVFKEGVGLVVSRTSTLEVVVSIYGPLAGALYRRVRTGLSVSQNREALRAEGLALVRVGDPTLVPELDGQEYVRRLDFRVTLRRQEVSTYDVKSLTQASADVVAQGGSVEGSVTWHNPTKIGPGADNG